MNQIVRTYRFESRSSSRTLLCDVFFMADYPGDTSPQLSVAYELGEPVSGALNPSRIRVHARPDLPHHHVLEELSRFFQTLKQMYEL